MYLEEAQINYDAFNNGRRKNGTIDRIAEAKARAAGNDPNAKDRPAWRAGGGPPLPGPGEGGKNRYNNTNIRAKVDTGLARPAATS